MTIFMIYLSITIVVLLAFQWLIKLKQNQFMFSQVDGFRQQNELRNDLFLGWATVLKQKKETTNRPWLAVAHLLDIRSMNQIHTPISGQTLVGIVSNWMLAKLLIDKTPIEIKANQPFLSLKISPEGQHLLLSIMSYINNHPYTPDTLILNLNHTTRTISICIAGKSCDTLMNFSGRVKDVILKNKGIINTDINQLFITFPLNQVRN